MCPFVFRSLNTFPSMRMGYGCIDAIHLEAREIHVWAVHLYPTNRLRSGKLQEERSRVPGLRDFIEANEPRLIAFNEYANEAGTEVAVVQVHPDTDSMEFHMEVVREQAERAYERTLDSTTGIQVFGTPTAAILEMLSRTAGSGVPVTVKPHHLGGFTR
jgi:hypothetical protein